MTKKQNLFQFVLIAMFIAIMAVMHFTPIGYIPIPGGLSVTLMTIPVALGAICTGKKGGAILGFVFGLTSFIQAFGLGAIIDPLASTFFNAKPLAYAFMCFVPRILAGLIPAIVFQLFKGKYETFAIILSSALVPILNTSLFMTSYILLYEETVLAGKTFMTVFLSAFTLNFLIEMLITLVAGAVINKVIYNYLKKIA